MRATVLVPTWRRPADLICCLDGLASQTRRPDEVLVTARGDDEETWELLTAKNLDGLRAVRVDTPGVIASLNTGLRAATGDLVAITDDDAVPQPDWLERIERHLASDAGLGGVGGRDRVHEGGCVTDGREEVVGRVHWFGRVSGNHHLGFGSAREVDLLKGVNMSFRAAALEGVSLREDLRGSNTQVHWEIDLCLAVKAAGWRLLYDPSVLVDHYPAPRHDEHQRMGLSLLAAENQAYNEMTTLLRWLPWPRKLTALAYGVLVGSRGMPGVVTGLERLARGQRRAGAFAACTRARLDAARAMLGRGSR